MSALVQTVYPIEIRFVVGRIQVRIPDQVDTSSTTLNNLRLLKESDPTLRLPEWIDLLVRDAEAGFQIGTLQPLQPLGLDDPARYRADLSTIRCSINDDDITMSVPGTFKMTAQMIYKFEQMSIEIIKDNNKEAEEELARQRLAAQPKRIVPTRPQPIPMLSPGVPVPTGRTLLYEHWQTGMLVIMLHQGQLFCNAVRLFKHGIPNRKFGGPGCRVSLVSIRDGETWMEGCVSETIVDQVIKASKSGPLKKVKVNHDQLLELKSMFNKLRFAVTTDQAAAAASL
jgi:hypothetical protein